MSTPSLSIQQRNLYLYYLNHKEKGLSTPCYVPPAPSSRNRLSLYLRAIERLEELHLVTVDRESDDYREWVMRDHEETVNDDSLGRLHPVPSPLWQSAPTRKRTA
jgi:hypothetical protein